MTLEQSKRFYIKICPGCGLDFRAWSPKELLCPRCDPIHRLTVGRRIDTTLYADDPMFAAYGPYNRDRLF